jgi:tripartite-type tricarboxylate transporter receptor subunit TctC
MNPSSVRYLLAALAALSAPLTALAQEWPVKAIHVVFPYPGGSAPDVVGRMISERVAKIVGQPLVFENRPGANGIVGTSYVAKAAPDGYTIHATTTSAFLLNSFLRKELPYDPIKSFVPITAAIDIPVHLIVSAKLPVNNTREFVDYLKRNPGKLNYASVGNGSFIHLLMEQFKAAAGADIVHVPYQGAAAIATELMAGRLDATVLSVGSVLPLLKSGQVKVLSSMTTKRTASLPEVPAISEEFPNLVPFGNWMGFVAPAGTPEPIVRKLNQAIVSVVGQPEVRAKILEERWGVIASTPEEFRALIQRDLPIIEAAVKSAGVKPE